MAVVKDNSKGRNICKRDGVVSRPTISDCVARNILRDGPLELAESLNNLGKRQMVRWYPRSARAIAKEALEVREAAVANGGLCLRHGDNVKGHVVTQGRVSEGTRHAASLTEHSELGCSESYVSSDVTPPVTPPKRAFVDAPVSPLTTPMSSPLATPAGSPEEVLGGCGSGSGCGVVEAPTLLSLSVGGGGGGVALDGEVASPNKVALQTAAHSHGPGGCPCKVQLESLLLLAESQFQCGDNATASEAAEMAVSLASSLHPEGKGPAHESVTTAMRIWADALAGLGDWARAESIAGNAWRLAGLDGPRGAPSTGADGTIGAIEEDVDVDGANPSIVTVPGVKARLPPPPPPTAAVTSPSIPKGMETHTAKPPRDGFSEPALVLVSLGRVLLGSGDALDAHHILCDAVDIWNELRERTAAGPYGDNGYVEALKLLSLAAASLGRESDAVDFTEAATGHLANAPMPHKLNMARCLIASAKAYTRVGRFAASERAIRSAMVILNQELPIGEPLDALLEAYVAAGELAEAVALVVEERTRSMTEEELDKFLAEREGIPAEEYSVVVCAVATRDSAHHVAMGCANKAVELATDGSVCAHSYGDVMDAYTLQGRLMTRVHNVSGAAKAFGAAYRFAMRTLPPTHQDLAAVAHEAGEAYHRAGDLSRAKKVLTHALEVWPHTLDADHPLIHRTKSAITRINQTSSKSRKKSSGRKGGKKRR